MKLVDSQRHKLIGLVKVETKKVGDNEWKVHDEFQNLVLNGSALILRNLMYNDIDERISKIVFGDMNLTEDDDLKNVEDPDVTDVSLDNKLFEKACTSELTTYNGNPAIIYTTIIEASEFNGSGTQLITEYGLANSYDRLFTRKTRAAIFKDNESSIKFTWTLVFA